MCGIFGYVQKDPAPPLVPWLREASRLLRHRGPDDEGYLLIDSKSGRYFEAAGADTDGSLPLQKLDAYSEQACNVALGHRRLSILDLSSLGHQPMSTGGGKIWITFNGEVYNYIEIREELKRIGCTFRSATDTEVILAAYRVWGTDAFRKFVGMFALAIYDQSTREVVLARDCFGIKPLYYAFARGRCAFASEIKPLLRLPGLPRSLNAEQLFQYLRHGIIDGVRDTLFDRIFELPPAHYLRINLDCEATREPIEYWNVAHAAPAARASVEGAHNELRGLLRESVRLHLRSDVPLGICLSGGLDSTALLKLMREAVGERTSIHAVSFITDDPLLSEKQYVEAACDQTVLRSVVSPSAADLERDLDDLVRTQELPFGGTSIYAQYRVFETAGAAKLKVMLDGQGSDELFAGYSNFLGARFGQYLAELRILAACRVMACSGAIGSPAWVRTILSGGSRVLPRWAAPGFRAAVGEPIWPKWLRREWFRERGVIGAERPIGVGAHSLRREVLLSTTRVSLPQILRYEDRNSMRQSIESRVPFLTPQLAEFAWSLPDDALVSPRGETKAILHTAMRGIVPDKINDRKKVGFATPERQWLARIGPTVLSPEQIESCRSLPFFADIGSEFKAISRSSGVWPRHVWRIINAARWSRLFDVTPN